MQGRSVQKRKINIPQFVANAQIRSNSFDEKTRSVDVVWSTGQRGLRGGFFTEPYYEELSMKPENVRLDRFKSGNAPVLNSHNQDELSDVIGVVENGDVRNNQGTARIRFSNRADVDPIVQDVRDGILRNISFGYRVYKYQEIVEEGVDTRILKAIDFEPMEISLVPVPFDSGASVRSQEKLHECEILSMRSEMENENTNPAPAEIQAVEPAPAPAEVPAADPAPAETPAVEPAPAPAEVPAADPAPAPADAAEVATRAERKRVLEITDAVRQAGLKREVADSFIEKGFGVDKARKEILTMLSNESNTGTTNGSRVHAVENFTRQDMLRGMEDAILFRANPQAYKMTEKGKLYANLSLSEIAAECLRAAGHDVRNWNKHMIAERAFHSTSDFPLLLENIVSKELRAGYEASPKTFTPFVRQRSLPDFKEVSSIQLGMAPALVKVAEGGEITAGTIDESAEKMGLDTYARKVRVTRRVIINDDLDALSQLPRMLGMRAATLESDLFWYLITSNQVMADGDALFHANHGNLAGAGAAISVATLSAGRKAIRRQKDFDGVTFLNLVPSYLVVSSTDETLAEQTVTAAQGQVYSPTATTSVNPFINKLSVIEEPRLDVSSGAQPWYLMTSNAMIPMAEWGVLQGQESGPIVSQYLDNETKGITFDALYDVVFKIIEHRGFYKNPGV